MRGSLSALTLLGSLGPWGFDLTIDDKSREITSSGKAADEEELSQVVWVGNCMTVRREPDWRSWSGQVCGCCYYMQWMLLW